MPGLKNWRAALLQHAATRWGLPLAGAARKAIATLRSEAARQASRQPRQLLVDVSIIAAQDAGTGIQRVVRSLLAELLETPPAGYTVRAIRATRKRPYVYADRYLETMTGAPIGDDDPPVQVRPGDLFLGLDLTSRISPARQADFLGWHAAGVRFAFVVYDMLPALHPAWFTPRAVQSFERWLTMLAIHADALFCISATVAGQTRRQPRLAAIPTGWFHLGAELAARQGAGQATADDITPCPAGAPRILMVGTIEPRKGHALVIDAFERLWRDGCQASLSIVGRAGWAVEALTARLAAHPESGKRLHWLAGAGDAELARLYESSDGLILASEGEGFGLPIIEAAAQRLPLLLRDLPVFREIAGDHASYFSSVTAAELAPRLQQWLEAIAAGTAPDSGAIKTLSWHESAIQLKSLISRLDARS
ncbi:glycosyltransferase family 4 protein [Burkholderia glumae]|uniref:glycosyltransferase family 4 protein n=1 Tax=Burkholderia glumae TaxID=337 RepID=UPI00146374AE|nr:glycosyltransferase family 1 protein [Burkholderia glumae]QJP73672.1 glycosyltransferase family 4 protein [Burkholderia glumae]